MGSPENELGRMANEGPQHQVRLDNFWLGQTEVTWNEYEEFYFGGSPPDLPVESRDRVDAVSRPTPPYGAPDRGWGAGSRPAMSMTYLAAERYCQWLSALTGKSYRLPTEAEWEYACKAGDETEPMVDPSALEAIAWSSVNSRKKTQEVALKRPNPWGLFDILGNVSELCSDRYDADYYKSHPPTSWPHNPKGPKLGNQRVVRGGSFLADSTKLRCSRREHTTRIECLVTDPNEPKSKWWYSDCFHIGFRIARSVKQ